MGNTSKKMKLCDEEQVDGNNPTVLEEGTTTSKENERPIFWIGPCNPESRILYDFQIPSIEDRIFPTAFHMFVGCETFNVTLDEILKKQYSSIELYPLIHYQMLLLEAAISETSPIRKLILSLKDKNPVLRIQNYTPEVGTITCFDNFFKE